jgi:hypothetical protein
MSFCRYGFFEALKILKFARRRSQNPLKRHFRNYFLHFLFFLDLC